MISYNILGKRDFILMTRHDMYALPVLITEDDRRGILQRY